MAVSGKTKKELIEENKELRSRLQELEHSEAKLRKAEQTLRESEFQYRTTLDSMRDAIHVVDADLKIILMNEKFVQWAKELDIEIDQPVGRNIFDLFPFLPDKVRDEYRRVLNTGKILTTVEANQVAGREIFIESRKIPVCEAGKVVKVITIIRDITKKKLAEDSIRESEEKFRSLAEQSPNMIFINKQGRIVYANKKCEEITGYKRKELYSPDFDFLTLIAPQSLDLVKENYSSRSKGREIPPYEYTLINKAGERIDAINSSRLIKYEGGSAILGVVTDITKRKRAEEALRRSEERYCNLFEGVPVGVYRTTPDGRILLANNALVRMLGYKSFEDLCERNLEEEGFNPGHPRSAFKECIKAKSSVVGYESAWIRVDGSVLFISENARIVKDDYGNILYYEGIVEDITERKKAEEALTQSEKKYRLLFENTSMPVTFWSVNDLRLLSINAKAAEMIDRTPEEVIGKTTDEVFYANPDTAEKARKIFKEVLESGKRYQAEDCVEVLKGVKNWFRTDVQPVMDKTGQIIAIQAISEDITKRKKTEEALYNREEMYRRLVEASAEAIFVLDLDGRITYVSPQAVELLGYENSEDVVGLTGFQSLAPEEIERGRASLQQTITDGFTKGVEYTFVKKNGTRILVENNAAVISDAHGQPKGLIVTSRDVTERKKAEEALRESEEQLRLAVQAAQLSTWDWDLLTDEVRLGGHSIEVLGFAPDVKSIPLNYFIEQVNPEDINQIQEAISKTINERTLYNEEYRIIQPDGTERWIAAQGQPFYDKTGKAIRMIGVNRDITEQKKAEEALRESDANLNEAQHIAHIGSWKWDLRTNHVEWSDELFRILGFEPNEVKADYDLWFKMIHPDDVEKAEEYAEATKKGNTEVAVEYRIIKRDKSVRHIYAKGRNHYDNNKPVQMTGIIQDITERKKTQEAVRYERDIAQKYLDVAGVMMMVIGADRKVKMINRRGCQILGYDEDEIIGKDWFENFLPERIHEKVKMVEEKLRAGETKEVEYFENPILTKSGQERIIAWHNSLLRDEEGIPNAVLCSGEDITERKRAEEALKISERNYREIFNTSNEAIFVHDIETGAILDVNQTMCEMFGYTREEAVKFSVGDLSQGQPPYNLDHARQWVRKAVEEGSQRFEWLAKRKSGELFWDETNLKHAVIGGQDRILAFVSDITERKKAEEVMKKSSVIIESTTDAVITTDIAGNITFWNKGAEIIYGYRKEEAIGKPISIIYKEEELHVLEAMIADLMEGKDIPGIEVTCIDKNQQDIEILLSLTSIRNENGNITGLVGITKDITERRQSEDRLRQSEERFKILFESAPDAYYIHDLEGNFIDGNKTAEQLIGYSREEVLGKNFFELGMVAEEDIPKVTVSMADNKDGKAAGPLELTLYRKDGSKVMVETRSYPVEIGGQTVVLGIARDITERKKAEVALRESEQRLKILFEYAPDAIFLSDLKGNIVDGNKTAEKMIGYAEDELIGENIMEAGLLSSEQLVRAIASLEKNAMGKPTGPDEFTLTRKDGSTVPVEIRTFPVRIQDQVLSLGIARDISARRKDEKKLFEYREQLKSLASELSLTEERERHRLATDLHDHISQALVFSRIKLQELHASVSSAEIAGPLGEACDNLERIIQDTRTLTFDLSSPILYELGFEAAVSEWLDEQIRKKHGIKTQFEDDGLHKPLEDDIRVLLFRNVRELLINIVKHANAQNVKVSLRRISQQIYVSVEDDGIGFNTAELASKAGFGIFSIRERLEQLAGHLEIESESGRGSKITMTAPLKRDEISREYKA